jgi:predicted ATPase/DNA-binding CsgD family transcriptional regulator
MAGDIPRVQNALLQIGVRSEPIPVDSPDWFTWLESATSFAFSDPNGSFTARHDAVGHGRGGRYWKAYRRRDGKLYRHYLGRSADLTLDRLMVAAAVLAESINRTNDPPSAGVSTATSSTAPLPQYLTSFVGRERDIARILELFERARLVTLTGTGGVGKTRLALRVATELQTKFHDGLLFVSLASIADAALVSATVAQAAGVKEIVGRSILEALKVELRDKRLLLVLDNFEHVASAAPLVAELLAASRGLKVLVTSRVMLHLSGEHEFQVAPLALPSRDANVTARCLADYEAVDLFVARARAARHDFVLTDQNAPTIVELCHRLDGLPLAIELAAARLRTLPLPMLLARLEHLLPLLTGGPRDAPVRQQTLYNTIAWSHTLLAPAEQMLFRRLAVLQGGTFDAIAAICFPAGAGQGTTSITLQAIDVDPLDGVTSLVEKNLLQQDELSDGQPWYTMLETIREFALERLMESGEADSVRRRHVLYYLTLAEAAEQEWLGPRQEAWLSRLKCEHDNLRTALQWCVDRGYAEPAFRLAVALWWFWAVLGYLTEGRERLTGLLARFPSRVSSDKLTVWRAQALRASGVLASIQGDYTAARAFHEDGLALRRQLGDPSGVFNALEGLGLVASQQGDHALARDALEEALSLASQLGDSAIYASTLQNLGGVLHAQGDNIAAQVLLEECVKLRRALGEPHHLSGALLSLAAVLQDFAEHEQARALVLEAIDLYSKHRNRRTEALALANLGSIATAQGDYSTADRYLSSSLTIQQELRDLAGIAYVLERYAMLAVARADPTRAVRLAGAAVALRDSVGVLLTPAGRTQIDRALEPARRSLGRRASEEAWEAGRALPLDEAILDALSPGELPSAKLGDVASALTKREKQVAALIAGGLTNRQIADDLIVAEGTVANHVVHILTKLGYNSRSQIAVWAANNSLVAAQRRQ